MTRRLLPDQQGLDEANAILRSGGLVAMPTETVYGLAANALDPVAVARIFEAKRRPSFDPLIVHLPSAERAFALATSVPDAARLLAATFWPGPLTLVLPRAATIPDIVAAELPTVGLRVPAHPIARQLLERVGIPLAAPSANLFGFVSPTSAAHVLDGLDGRIDALIDGGPCTHGLESTIVAFEEGRPIILRHGTITREQIAALCGDVGEGARVLERPLAPGQLARHYATRTPLRLFECGDQLPEPAGSAALIVVAGPIPESQCTGNLSARALSSAGSLTEAAANLFSALREADASGASELRILTCDDSGLGRAINDRLRRAAVRA
jgi:L-threonylcarbamoyladenylate synthase